MTLLAAEVRRCADKGARALAFPENTAKLGLPSFHTDHWDPVCEAVTETDMVVCMHIGTSAVMQTTSEDATIAIGISLAPMNAQSV